jgi:hypothetical protein
MITDQQQFIDRHEFLGNISNGHETVENLQIVLHYPLMTQGKITGEIWGTKETFDKVFQLWDKTCEQTADKYSFRLNCEHELKVKQNHLQSSHRSPFITIEIPPETQKIPSLVIESQRVDIQPVIKSDSTYHSHLPSIQIAKRLEFNQFVNSHEMFYKIAEIDCEDVKIVTKHDPIENLIERRLSFFLAGNPKIWLRDPDELSFSSFTGKIERTFKQFKINLGENFPGEIEIVPRFFHDQSTRESIIGRVPVLQITTTEPEQSLSNEQFIELGIKTADDLVLLVSLIHKRWATWYLYELQTQDTEQIFYRNVPRESLPELDILGPLVTNDKIEEFLKVGLKNLQRLRAESFNLSMPIAYFIAGHEARHLEEQFAITFLSLEKLKDMFARKEKYDPNLPRSSFEKFRELTGLSKLIEESVPKIENQREDHALTIKNIQDQIPVLNHPPIRFVVEKLLSKYQLDWKELYPLESKVTLIKTRDKLFHTSAEPNADFLLKETERLQALVGRLLLRLLGWEDISCSPPDYLQDILTKQETQETNVA